MRGRRKVIVPNIATALKSEIGRIARKEIRSETGDLKKATAQYRTHIAALRKRLDQLERMLKRTSKVAAKATAQSGRAAPAAEDDSEGGVQRRFSAKRLASTRAKLGLSAADFAALIGVSGLSVYKWEQGKARPRAKQLEAIASVRGIGKREAAERLAAIRSKPAASSKTAATSARGARRKAVAKKRVVAGNGRRRRATA